MHQRIYPLSTPARKRGRPTVYDPSAIWPLILEHIASGDALSTAIKRLGPNAPSYIWAKTQLRANAVLQAAYREAIEDRADALADEIISLADTPPPEGLDGSGLHAWVAQLKLRVHAREWTAAKLRPRVYGQSLDVTVQATSISITAALERAQSYQLGASSEKQTAFAQVESNTSSFKLPSAKAKPRPMTSHTLNGET